jgi:large subunit ribosomal protein L20
MRVRRGTARRAKHNKILAQTKGYSGRRRSVFKLAKQAVIKAGQYAYRDRKVNKRNFRALWIVKINAAARQFDMSYSVFMKKLALAKIELNRKMLADLAQNHPQAFETIAKKIK